MRGLIGSVACVAWLCFCASTGLSEPTPSSHDAAIRALNDGDTALSLQISNAILIENPNDFLAQYLVAFALSESGEHKAAAIAAQRAFQIGPSDKVKLLAARVAASARFRAGQYTRAEWWLRRAANKTSTPEEALVVFQEFQAIRQKNPLSLRFGVSVAPSNNINGGTEDRTFSLGEFDFIFGEDSRSLSGIEYSGDIEVFYRLSESKSQLTRVGFYGFGRTFSLSSGSRSAAPDVSGNDYALGLAELSLSHDRSIFNGLGPTGVSVHFGQVWYGGDPLWRYRKLALSQGFPVGQTGIGSLQISVEDQTSLDPTQPDTVVYYLGGTYSKQLPNQNILRLTFRSRLNDAEFETNTYTDHSATISYDFAKPMLGSRWSVSFGAGAKSYDEFSLSLDGRRDRYVTVGATAVIDSISHFGFSPSWTVSATKTESNVTRFSTLEVTGRLSVQSNF